MTGDPTDVIKSAPDGSFSPPAALLPYQQRWIADPSPFKVMEKGRRTGITWAEAADDVLIAAAARNAGGQNVYYVGTDKEMTEEYIQACAMWVRAFNKAAGQIEEGLWDEGDNDKDDDNNIRTFTIRFPKSGFRIVALASRPRKLRGRQGVLIGDEAAFQDNLQALIEAAMAFLIWGGKVRLISTHDGVSSDFNTLVQDIRAGKQKGSLHRVTFRQAVAEGLYRRVCLRLGKTWSASDEASWVEEIYDYYKTKGVDQELDCIPTDSGGRWLSRALIEARMVDAPVLRWECAKGFETLPEHIRYAECQEWIDPHLRPLIAALDPKLTSGLGEDFARSGDLTVFAPYQIQQSLRRVFPFLVELRNVPFRQQEQILFFLGDNLPRFMSAALDARGNGQYLAEVAMQRWGAARVEQIMLTEGWYRDNTAPFKAALEDDLMSIPRDSGVLDDLRGFEVIKGVARIPEKHSQGEDGKQRHGDAGIALVLGHYASRREVAPIEFQSTGSRSFGAVGGSLQMDVGFGAVPGGNDFLGWHE